MHEMLLGVGRKPQSADPDVDSFLYRVAMNGGTVSSATKGFVETFVTATKSTGVWDLLNRINLFCGDSILAASVPLKVGNGSKVDALFNITAADYSETGLTAGFRGNASNKYLDTGLIPASLPAFNNHLSVFQVVAPSGASTISSHGCGNSTGDSRFAIFDYINAKTVRSDFYNDSVGSTTLGAYSATQNLILVSRTSASYLKLYALDRSITNSNTVPNSTPTTQTVRLLRTEGGWSNGTYGGYSVGVGMTDQNVTDFRTALMAFQTSLGRVA